MSNISQGLQVVARELLPHKNPTSTIATVAFMGTTVIAILALLSVSQFAELHGIAHISTYSSLFAISGFGFVILGLYKAYRIKTQITKINKSRLVRRSRKSSTASSESSQEESENKSLNPYIYARTIPTEVKLQQQTDKAKTKIDPDYKRDAEALYNTKLPHRCEIDDGIPHYMICDKDDSEEGTIQIDIDHTAEIGIATTRGRKEQLEETYFVSKFTVNGEEVQLWAIFQGEETGPELPQFLKTSFQTVSTNLQEELKEKSMDHKAIADFLTETFVSLDETIQGEGLQGTANATCILSIGKQIYVATLGNTRAVLIPTNSNEPVVLSYCNAKAFGYKSGVYGRENARPTITYWPAIKGHIVLGTRGLFEVASNNEIRTKVKNMQQYDQKLIAAWLTYGAVIAKTRENVTTMVIAL